MTGRKDEEPVNSETSDLVSGLRSRDFEKKMTRAKSFQSALNDDQREERWMNSRFLKYRRICRRSTWK